MDRPKRQRLMRFYSASELELWLVHRVDRAALSCCL